jgi:hypothetical protein
MGVHQHNVAVADKGGNRRQSSLQTRAPNALAVRNTKQSAMNRALNHVAVPAQEAITGPVERRAGVRAGVDVRVYGRACAHQAYAGAVAMQKYFFAGLLADLVEAAQDAFGFGIAMMLRLQVPVGHNVADLCNELRTILTQCVDTRGGIGDLRFREACSE